MKNGLMVPEEFLICTASHDFKVRAQHYRVDGTGTLFMYLEHGGELVFAASYWQGFQVGDGAKIDVTRLNKL